MGRPLKIDPLLIEDYNVLHGKGFNYIQPELHLVGTGPMIDAYLDRYTCAICEDERVIGAFGVCPTAPGVANVWLMATQQLRAHPISLFKLGHRMVRYAFAKYSFHRLEANVAEDFDAGHNYITELGFQFEGIRRSFGGPGQDFHFYARLSE